METLLKHTAEQVVICRVGYCENCFKNLQPRINQPFLVFGSTGYHFKKAVRTGTLGFTPHIYKLVIIENNHAFVQVSCGMYECKVKKHFEVDAWFYYIPNDAWEDKVFPLHTWNELIKYKTEDDFFI